MQEPYVCLNWNNFYGQCHKLRDVIFIILIYENNLVMNFYQNKSGIYSLKIDQPRKQKWAYVWSFLIKKGQLWKNGPFAGPVL